jgi:hypothetical protein
MKNRGLLRSHLRAAWKDAVTKGYNTQLINSERGLQFYFCEALLRIFENAGMRRRLFIEPCLSISGKKTVCYPDVVICSSRIIIGVVEIKYTPRVGIPKTASKDIKTLSFAANNSRNISLSNDRYRGPQAGKKEFQLADDAVLCWAGIYSGDMADLGHLISVRQHRERFLQLNALTRQDQDPRIIMK